MFSDQLLQTVLISIQSFIDSFRSISSLFLEISVRGLCPSSGEVATE